MQTIHRTYETFEDARNVVARLEAEGLRSEQISLVGRNRTGDDGAAEGAAIGGAIGGAGGLIAALAAVTVPGLGPLLAAGWLGCTLIGAGTGALAGGVLGALADAGIARGDAEAYAETIRGGGSLVSVRALDLEAPRVRMVMDAAVSVEDFGKSAPARPIG
ncbi:MULTISPECIES: hypothetical protein [unclassified Bosea (in: a-proteobacteria)]|uniref:hypothetical protein n=1 Tax=unclassified Bosea (in: a-proteobacteria) TaxID=2653178 RepID=UPI0009553E7B|nr:MULTISPECIES: hypothetical protein [unclassified Bosea (in: a-proteobacteria)]TAJ29525.1 MAG: hypothetical protein EPO59_14830 [Bosea sp. (in: a-proteobacteria)]SIQ77112.1 hypothetical protein SAMN05880592_105198 [Bosea sp. TND4EK4]